MKMKIKQTLRSMWALILAVLMILSTFSAVAVTLNKEATGATGTTVYICPSQISDFISYVDSSTGELKSEFELRLNTNHKGDGEDWNQYSMRKYEKTIGNKAVYVCSFTDTYDGLGCIQFQIYQGSTNKTQIQPFGTKQWTQPSVYNNKLWNGSNWVAPSWDSSSGSSEEYTIYFKDTLGWGSVYAHFYNDTYSPSDTNGCSGSSATQNIGALTKIGDTDVYSKTFTSSTAYTKVCFTKYQQDNYGNFHNNEAAYRTDLNFASGKTMYVPDKNTSENKNNTTYYNTGTWQTYGSTTTTTTTTATTSTTSPTPSTNWYLTGWINKGSVTNTSIPFTQSATDSNIYELTYTFKGNEGGYQYPTIFDGTKAYHPATHGSGSGTVGSTVDTTPGNDPKWKVEATTGDTVDFTWDSSTKVLSWSKRQAVTTYDVTLATGITGGSISGTIDGSSTLTGLSGTKRIDLTATANQGYTFTGWSASTDDTNIISFDDVSSATTTATVKGACTITATFAKNSTPDVANGVTLKASPTEVIVNNPVTLTATLDTPNAGAANVKYTFNQTSGSTVTLSSNGTASNKTTFTPTEAGTYKFTVTASCDDFNPKTSTNEVTVTVITAADAKKNAFSEGIWIDAQPTSNNTDALIKAHIESSGNVKFYLPNYVDLSKLHIYHKYGYLKIADQEITSGVTTPDASSWTNGNIEIIYGENSSSKPKTIKVFQSTAKTLFTSTSTNMPTTTNQDVIGGKITPADYKKQCSFSGTYRAIDSSGNAIANNTIKLKGRGNSSWEMSARFFGKYAYNITLGGAVDLVSASGKSTASKKWSMLANNVDEAMMRNMLVYNLSDAIGLPDSPMSNVYNVYNNGTYLGSYQMSEKVEVGDNLLVPGINVDKLNKDANTTGGVVAEGYEKYGRDYQNGTNINDTSTAGFYKYCTGFTQPEDYKTGNYLLEFELNERFSAETCGFISNYGQQVVLKSPEVATQNEVEYAMDRFNFAEAVIYALAEKKGNGAYSLPEGSSSPTATLTISNGTYKYTGKLGEYTASGITDVIDVENFAKAYLIQEFTENLDGVATSFYVDITGEKDVLVSKPVWDFDWTMGQYNGTKKIDNIEYNPSVTNQWFIRYKNIYPDTGTKNIIAKLCSIESFWNTVKTVWNGTSSASLFSTGSSSLFPVSALMGKKASLNPVGSGTAGVYDTIKGLYGDGGLITGDYKNTLSSSVAMNEDRYNFISDPQYSQWNSKNTGATWEEAVNYLDTWANKRATWMNARLNDVPEEKNYLYFKDEGNYNTDGSTIHAHIYNYSNKESAADWPGIAMVLIDPENKIYRVEYTDNNYTNVIFSKNGNSKIGNENDLITQFSTNNMLVYSGTGEGQWHWETYQEAGTYKVNQANTTNGSFTVSPSTANEGDTITITATPADGYVVDTVTVTGASGTVEVTGTGNTRTFTMPAENVTVSVTFKEGTASDYVVYLDNAAKWANPKAYAWNGGDGTTDKNGDWPGVAMNHVTGNIYMLTFTKEYANIIFSDNGSNKTDNLAFGSENNGKIYNNSTKSWSVYNPNQTITVSAGTCTGGSVTINGSASVSDLKLGDQITLTANASDGYAFTGWNTVTGLSITDPNSAQTSASITSVDDNITVTANFSSSKSGYFIKGTFNEWKETNPLYTTSGNVTTTTITLKAGTYKFKVWKKTGDVWYGNNGTIKDTTTTSSPDGWTMNNEGSDAGDCTLEATGGTYTFTFNTNTKKLIITKGAAGNTATVISQDTDGNTLIGESLAYISSYTKVGESTPSANTTSSVNDIEDGTSVIFTAPTNQYYTFKYWLVNGVQTGPTETDGVSLKIDNVTYDFDVYAVYGYITSDVAIAETTHGTVTTDKTTAVRAGEVVTISLTPDSGYSTKTVVVTDADGSNIPVTGSANRYTFVMPNKKVTVSATFAKADTFTVTYASNDITMGTVSADFTSGSKFENGTSLTVTATANEGYMFAGWYSDAQLTTKVYDNTP